MYVPSSEGARTIFANDFAIFGKAYVKPMADAVGVDSLFVAAQESHTKMRHLLADPFSLSSLPTYIQKFDKILSQELKALEERGERFSALALCMKVTINLLRRNKTGHPVLEILRNDCRNSSFICIIVG